MNFLSLFLVVFSIGFLWWFNYNMINLPRFFVFSDFFAPVFYLLLMFFFIVFLWKLLIKEFVYKFLVDYLANSSVFKIKNIKFLDIILVNLVSSGYSFFSFGNIYGLLPIKSLGFSRVVFIVFFFFIIL